MTLECDTTLAISTKSHYHVKEQVELACARLAHKIRRMMERAIIALIMGCRDTTEYLSFAQNLSEIGRFTDGFDLRISSQSRCQI